MPQGRRALSTYEAKRDFSRTREPKAGGKSRGDLFVVQHHWATREHYDFRLELDGVLLSWAVTRGPSFNPADKRLAVRTEDHPIAYANFEGTIPKGDYGGGTVQIWDRGHWQPQEGVTPAKALRTGMLKFVLHGKRMRGRWVLVRMKKEGKRDNWLLIKERDEFAKDKGSIDQFRTSVKTGRTKSQIEGSRPKPRTSAAKKAAGTSKRRPAPDLVPPMS
jgi:bifunctional non-homologous end joining protein LigD